MMEEVQVPEALLQQVPTNYVVIPDPVTLCLVAITCTWFFQRMDP